MNGKVSLNLVIKTTTTLLFVQASTVVIVTQYIVLRAQKLLKYTVRVTALVGTWYV